MTRGRKPALDRPVEWYIYLPGTLAAKVELLLFDPVTQKAQFGGRSKLIQRLLNDWVHTQQREAQIQNLTSPGK